ncbi:hypothetical protein MKX01_000454 [Papaver californicum]|nr:hypothetical protein MKX01_000454 [Papaver californicum]
MYPPPSNALLDTAIGAYIQQKRSDLALQAFNKLKQNGYRPNLLTCDTLLHSYASYNRMHDEFGCCPDNVTYNTIFSVYCAKGLLNEARDLLLDMKGKQLETDRRTFNIFVSGFCGIGWLEKATKTVELMIGSNYQPDDFTFNTLISGFCKEGRIDEAFRLLELRKSAKLLPDAVTYNALINGCFKWRTSLEAIKLFEEMCKKDVKPTVITHNIIIKGFCEEKKLKEAREWVEKMGESGVSPDWLRTDVVALNTFLHTLCNKGKLNEAYELLCSAPKKGYDLDEVSYGTLIMGYFKEENVDGALKLWDEMKKKKKILPSVVTYNSVIGGLCKTSKIKQAMDKFTELSESGLIPDAITYNTLIHGHCREGDVEKAFQFYSQMVAKSFKPDVFTCNILLHALCKEQMLDRAVKLFRTWVSREKAVDAVTYNTLIMGLCKGGEIEYVLDLLLEMKEKKLGPDHCTYNSIISTLVQLGRTDEALNFLSKMKEAGKIPNKSSFTFQEVIACYSEDQESTGDKTYTKHIDELCTEGKFKEANCVLEKMKQQGVAVSKSTYITLMKGLIKRRKRTSNVARDRHILVSRLHLSFY